MEADFLTATHRDAHLYAEHLQLLGERRAEGILYGYRGFRDDRGNFCGRNENGRYLSTFAGGVANGAFAKLRNAPGEISVARLDLQVTVCVLDADEVVKSLEPHVRYKAYRYIPANDSTKGATLYVGAPRSRKRLRVYNKTAQANLEAPMGEFLRIELQLRDSNADWFHAVSRRGWADLYAAFRSKVVLMAKGLEDILPSANTAHVHLEEEKPVASYRIWLEASVLKGVQRALATGDEETLQLLYELRDMLVAALI